jgi:hypothetical protein
MRIIATILIALLSTPVTGLAQSCYAPGEQELTELRSESALLRDAKPISACLYGNTTSLPPQVKTIYEFLQPASDTFQGVAVTRKVMCERSARPLRCTAFNVAQLPNGSLVELDGDFGARELHALADVVSRLLGTRGIVSVGRAEGTESGTAYDVTVREADREQLRSMYTFSHECRIEGCTWNVKGPSPAKIRVY